MDPVRAWKDPLYRASLSEEERRDIPAHPAGIVELSDVELNAANGGTTTACATLITNFTLIAGCWSWNATACNGTCSFSTTGCCG